MPLRFLVVLGFIAGCTPATPPPDPHLRLEAARQLWHERAPSSYSFEYRLDCFCPNARVWWRVVVENGKVVHSSVVDASQARRLIENPLPEHPTIDHIFDHLVKAEARHPQTLSVDFHYALHYPTRAYIDPGGTVVDGEWRIEVRDLAPNLLVIDRDPPWNARNAKPAAEPAQMMRIASDLERKGSAKEARKAYMTAARSGSCDAAKRLGDIYAEGILGAARDLRDSRMWYGAARVLGCEVADEKVK